jgi:RNA polymerase sigma-70 factor (ECF subfamily)
LVNGVPGLVVSRHGRPGSVVGFTIKKDKIVGIDILADPARIRRLKLAELWNEAPS